MSTTQSYLIGGFLNFAGPITLLAFLFWLNSLWTLFGPFHQYLRPNWKVILLALLGAVVVFASTKVDFKVLSDETNLLSVANMLSVFGKASNTEMWQYYYHGYHALDVAVPSRPILFPVFVSLIQLIVGIKWWSPFVVNFLALWGLFALVLRWAERVIPSHLLPRSTALVVLLMSPILSISATSAGYDLVSLTVGFASFLLLLEYEKRRDSATLECLLLALVCFASVRYESIVAIPFTLAGLFLLEGKGILKKISLQTIGLCSLLILPLIVQRYLTWGSFENPPGVAPFSPLHAWKHLPVFAKSFFLDGNGPYPILLHWLGVGGLILAIRRMKGVGMIPLVFSGFVLLLLLCHHFGLANHPTQARLFIPISFSLGLLAVYLLKDLEKLIDARYLLMIFVVLCFHHREYAIRDPLTTQLTMTREVRHIRDFLATDGREGDIWVYDRPGQLSALGLSSISWTKFKDETKNYLQNMNAHLYTRMLVIERVPYREKNPEEFALDRVQYRLTPLRKHQLSPEEYLRVSVLEPLAEVAPAISVPVKAKSKNAKPRL